jgi:hypothetical protein
MKNLKNLIIKAKLFISCFTQPVFFCVYTSAKNEETKSYWISSPKIRSQYDNLSEGKINKGIRAYSYNRKGVRSFEYARINHLTELSWLESYNVKLAALK